MPLKAVKQIGNLLHMVLEFLSESILLGHSVANVYKQIVKNWLNVEDKYITLLGLNERYYCIEQHI